MTWIAIATTIDNIVIAAHTDMPLLEEVSDYDFDVIVKMYNITEGEWLSLQSNKNYAIKYHDLRNVKLVPHIKSIVEQQYTEIYAQRIQLLSIARNRFQHALNRYKPLMSQQYEIYQEKVSQAKAILENSKCEYVLDSYVSDYAEESGLDIKIAAKLIIEKNANYQHHLRKVERMRLRHFKNIKTAKNTTEFTQAFDELDKDIFVNLLL